MHRTPFDLHGFTTFVPCLKAGHSKCDYNAHFYVYFFNLALLQVRPHDVLGIMANLGEEVHTEIKQTCGALSVNCALQLSWLSLEFSLKGSIRSTE